MTIKWVIYGIIFLIFIGNTTEGISRGEYSYQWVIFWICVFSPIFIIEYVSRKKKKQRQQFTEQKRIEALTLAHLREEQNRKEAQRITPKVKEDILDRSDEDVKITTYTMSEDHISFTLAGTNFCDIDELDRIEELEYGESLILMPEPNNPFDSNAIMVQTRDKVKIGYVPKEIIHELVNSNNFLKPHRCVFTKKSDHTKPFINVYVKFI